MAHPYWVKEEALNATLAKGMIMGYPERSTVMNLLINVREGFLSNCMVPFMISNKEGEEPKPTLPWVAGVEHMRNGYSTDSDTPLGKTPVELALKGKTTLPREGKKLKEKKNRRKQEHTGPKLPELHSKSHGKGKGTAVQTEIR
jgi:hypothetical protein